MATFYPINFRRAIPEIEWSHSLNEDSAAAYVEGGIVFGQDMNLMRAPLPADFLVHIEMSPIIV